MQEDRRGRPERQIDKDVINEIFEETDLPSTRELKNEYLKRTEEDGLGWNTLDKWLKNRDEYEVAKRKENVTLWRRKEG